MPQSESISLKYHTLVWLFPMNHWDEKYKCRVASSHFFHEKIPQRRVLVTLFDSWILYNFNLVLPWIFSVISPTNDLHFALAFMSWIYITCTWKRPDGYSHLYCGYFIYKIRDWNRCSMTSLSEIIVCICDHTDFTTESTYVYYIRINFKYLLLSFIWFHFVLTLIFLTT